MEGLELAVARLQDVRPMSILFWQAFLARRQIQW